MLDPGPLKSVAQTVEGHQDKTIKLELNRLQNSGNIPVNCMPLFKLR